MDFPEELSAAELPADPGCLFHHCTPSALPMKSLLDIEIDHVEKSGRFVRSVPRIVEQVSDDIAFGLGGKTRKGWVGAKAVAKVGLSVRVQMVYLRNSRGSRCFCFGLLD